MRSPTLDRRITIRNPAERPIVPTDAYGRETEAPREWGVEVWASRRDSPPRSETVEGGVVIQRGRSVFTIRARRGVPAFAEIVSDGEIWRSIGPAVHVGGAGHGRAAQYLEIHAKRVA